MVMAVMELAAFKPLANDLFNITEDLTAHEKQ
jgi:hypothetical protein